jgi:hypothetical protein
VLALIVLSVRRLAARGRSRMNRALVVTGATIVGLAAIGLLLSISW